MTFLLIWFLTGLILAPFSYAITLADIEDRHVAWIMAFLMVLSPLSFLQVFLMSDFAKHGLKWK